MTVRVTDPIDDLAPGTPVDRGNCHREPIHAPGAIQPHGVLLTAELERMAEMSASNLGPGTVQL